MPEPLLNQTTLLETLALAPANAVKTLADELLPKLEARGQLEVLENRTGLAMLPYRDTVQGTLFHLGEVLLAEGRVRLNELEGYGAVLGRDLEHALAMALTDLAWQSSVGVERIEGFVRAAQAAQLEAQDALYRKVEATRVQMETF
jgi:alpha-D-ribose 1-methylphosphonate 5-triphosphate synthase subunit PhnG